MKVMIVDDEEDIGFILALEVQRAGHEPVTFSAASDAMTYLRGNSVDMIICDYQMPNITGRDFLLWIKERNLDLPFFILTGELNTEVNELLSMGTTKVLFKPQDLPTIKCLIEQISEAKSISQA